MLNTPWMPGALLLLLLLGATSCSDKQTAQPSPIVEEPLPQKFYPTTCFSGADIKVINFAPAPKDERLGTAFMAIGTGDYKVGMAQAQAVLDDHPRHPRAEFILALGLHKSKRYAEAQPLFESAEYAGTDFAGKEAVPYYLAWCYFWLGEFDCSRAAFERHLSHNEEGDSYFGLGIIDLELGQPADARIQLTRALEIFESRVAVGSMAATLDLAKTHARLADVDMAVDDDESARSHLDQSLNLDPNRPAVWFKLYNLALATGDSQRAAEAKSNYERLSVDAGSMAGSSR